MQRCHFEAETIRFARLSVRYEEKDGAVPMSANTGADIEQQLRG